MMGENISKFISNDISRCDNYKCERRNHCARHRQLIADKDNTDESILFSVTTFENNKCKYFISI